MKKYELSPDAQAAIEAITKPMLESLAKGYEVVLSGGQSFGVAVGPNQYTVGDGWSLRFWYPLCARGEPRKRLRPLRFVATNPEGTVTLTVDGKEVSRRLYREPTVQASHRHRTGASAYIHVGA